MTTKRKVASGAGVVLLLLLAGWAVHRLWVQSEGRGVVAPFTLVESLSRQEQFLSDFSLRMPEQDVPVVTLLWDWQHIAAWTPDGGTVYLTPDRRLIKISAERIQLQSVDLSHLVDQDYYSTTSIAGVGADRVWLYMYGYDGRILVEVLMEGESGRTVVHKFDVRPTCLAVDNEHRKVIGSFSGPYNSIRIYDIDSIAVVKELADEQLADSYFTNVDWQPAFAAVFSNGRQLLVVPESGPHRLIEGTDPVIGADEYIYFRRGDTQLWRCSIEGEPELVFEGTRGILGTRSLFSFSIVSGSMSREFVIFQYLLPETITRRSTNQFRLMIDLINHEASILRTGRFIEAD